MGDAHTFNSGRGTQPLTPSQNNSLAPYEKRVIELLRNSKDKRARKLAKKRVCITESFHRNHTEIHHTNSFI